MKAIQLLMVAISSLMTAMLFIGLFFNPMHIITCAMSAYLTFVLYKEKNW